MNQLNSFVYKSIQRLSSQFMEFYPEDFSSAERETYAFVKKHTMTSSERVICLIRAVEYVVKTGIAGAFVECGVWRGGSVMAIAKTLSRLGAEDRDIFLYDTFKGMTQPDGRDAKRNSKHSPLKIWERTRRREYNDWCYAPIEGVRSAMRSTGYPTSHVHFVEGNLEQTLKIQIPNSVALLRLDTDFFTSTLTSVRALFPLLTKGGILLIDDYYTWAGVRKAVDCFLAEHKYSLFLSRVDTSAAIAVKQI